MTTENSRADALTPCVHADDPKSCYRVRCQLGGKCVDDDMSSRQPAAAPIDECDTDHEYRWPSAETPASSPADERAARAEAALRALADECENDATAGWEERMRRCIDDANRVLARAASANETGAEGAAYRAGIEAVAKFIDKKAADYLDEYGYVEHDTGAVSWGSGNHADAKRDYHSSLVELSEEIRATLKGDDHA